MKLKPVLFGYSWVGILNQLLLQWFFIRLEGSIDIETREIRSFRVIGFIVPLTGWWNRYWWVWRFSK